LKSNSRKFPEQREPTSRLEQTKCDDSFESVDLSGSSSDSEIAPGMLAVKKMTEDDKFKAFQHINYESSSEEAQSPELDVDR
jgi:hypothetical protein